MTNFETCLVNVSSNIIHFFHSGKLIEVDEIFFSRFIFEDFCLLYNSWMKLFSRLRLLLFKIVNLFSLPAQYLLINNLFFFQYLKMEFDVIKAIKIQLFSDLIFELPRKLNANIEIRMSDCCSSIQIEYISAENVWGVWCEHTVKMIDGLVIFLQQKKKQHKKFLSTVYEKLFLRKEY